MFPLRNYLNLRISECHPLFSGSSLVPSPFVGSNRLPSDFPDLVIDSVCRMIERVIWCFHKALPKLSSPSEHREPSNSTFGPRLVWLGITNSGPFAFRSITDISIFIRLKTIENALTLWRRKQNRWNIAARRIPSPTCSVENASQKTKHSASKKWVNSIIRSFDSPRSVVPALERRSYPNHRAVCSRVIRIKI